MKNSNLLPLFLSIAIVQTIIIGLLFFEIEILNRNLQESKGANLFNVQPDIVQASNTELTSSQKNLDTTDNYYTKINEKNLRQLIRSTIRTELEAYFSEVQLTDSIDNSHQNQTKNLDFNNHPELVDQFSQDIEKFISQGGISNQAMEKLHSDLAQLNPNEQRQILSRLAKEINSGRIKIAQ